MVRVDVVQVHELSADHERRWREIRSTHRVYASPFFALDFVRAAHRSRPCYVAIIEEAGRVIGFWAFERHRGVAAPVGHPGSDHHGPIVPMDWQPLQALSLRAPRWFDRAWLRWMRGVYAGSPAQSLLGASRRHIYRFTALPAEQRLWRGYHRAVEGSPIVLLASYEHPRTNSNSNLGRKIRVLARDVGPLRFEPECLDTKAFDTLIAWKRTQCQATDFPDFGEDPRRLALLRDLWATQTPELRSWLSVLWAGDRMVAAHFGPLSERVWHWWLPRFDTSLRKHSPGDQMMYQMLRVASQHGIEWLDFGTGAEDFKRREANDRIDVASGTVYSPLASVPVAAKQLLKSVFGGRPRAITAGGGQ